MGFVKNKIKAVKNNREREKKTQIKLTRSELRECAERDGERAKKTKKNR